MKYNLSKFNQDTNYYKKIFSKIKKESILVIFDIEDESSFFSLAPLSLALHELGNELCVSDSKKESIQVLRKIWQTGLDSKNKVKSKSVFAYDDFVTLVNSKTKNEFSKVLIPPKIILIAKNGKWNLLTLDDFLKNKSGNFVCSSNVFWLKKHKWLKLMQTAKTIWTKVYDLKKSERVSCRFDLIETPAIRKKPLNDYLDSFLIVYSMAICAKKMCKFVSMGTSSARKEMLDFPEKISDLSGTLLGCELEKNINDPIFKKYRVLSTELKIKLTPFDASFGIKGEGYAGMHVFGKYIGYPTPNKKAKWQSPAQIMYKFPWWPQSKSESRKPMARTGFTDTIPLEIFIETNNIDWFKLEKRNRKIMAIVDKSDIIQVLSNKKDGSNFTVHLKGEKRRHAKSSGIDIRSKIDKDYLRETGIYAGTMANLPGGEAFLTPEEIVGKFIGDVVISVDRSYVIPKKNPLVIVCDKANYKIISGDKKIIKAINKEKSESLKLLGIMEKTGAVSKEIADLKRKNFNRLGEFAINTNPKARLCDYLIVNEKIANMIHIALGSGFDADRASTYHFDIVIDAKSQKLDIFGETLNKKTNKVSKTWILKKGKFVI